VNIIGVRNQPQEEKFYIFRFHQLSIYLMVHLEYKDTNDFQETPCGTLQDGLALHCQGGVGAGAGLWRLKISSKAWLIS